MVQQKLYADSKGRFQVIRGENMYLPQLNEIATNSQEINVFGGINDTQFIPNGSFKNMKNMSSDYYPVLGPRKPRKIYESTEKINGMIGLNNDVYVAAGNSLYKNNQEIEGLYLEDSKKDMKIMGAYIIIRPDNIMYNTAAEKEEDKIKNMTLEIFQSTGTSFYLSDKEGNRIIIDTKQIDPLIISNKDNMYNLDKAITDLIKTQEAYIPKYCKKKTVYYAKIEGQQESQEIYDVSIAIGTKNNVEQYSECTSYPLYYAAINSDNEISLEKYSPGLSMWSTVEVYVTWYAQYKNVEPYTAKKILKSIKEGDFIKIKTMYKDGEEYSDYTKEIIKEKKKPDSHWTFMNHFFNRAEVLKIRDNLEDAKEPEDIIDIGLVFSNVGVDILKVLRDMDGFMKTGKITSSATGTEVILKRVIYSLQTVLPVSGGMIDNPLSDATVIMKDMPEMDYVTVSNNRMWGCSNKNHEIYACKQGDPTSWYCYKGLASDSYAVTIGSQGDFTGAVTYKGEPYFFKENLIITMYGTKPANYQLDENIGLGIESGSEQSPFFLNGFIYYKSTNGIVRFNGGSATRISDELGSYTFKNAIGCASNKKYYISMERNGERVLYVYDAEKQMWHMEDDIQPIDLINIKNSVYAIVNENDEYKIVRMCGENDIYYGPGIISEGVEEEQVKWLAETGHMDNMSTEHKYIQKLGIRFQSEKCASLKIRVQYDNEQYWKEVYCKEGIKREGAQSLTLRPRRCEKFRLKFEGTGVSNIRLITMGVNEGSDKQYGHI